MLENIENTYLIFFVIAFDLLFCFVFIYLFLCFDMLLFFKDDKNKITIITPIFCKVFPLNDWVK